MDQYIEFTYESISGQTFNIEGKTDGNKVRFIVYDLDHKIVVKSNLTTLDKRNIEEYIIDNSEPEMDYFDLDYRNER